LTILHSFSATTDDANSDGALPFGGLILSDGTLYGTTRHGGTSGNGTVFAIHTDGTGFTNLHHFSGLGLDSDPDRGTNDDGATPVAELILLGSTLYGTTLIGGSSGSGTVFKLNMDGTEFTTLHSFAHIPAPNTPNSDGAQPHGLLLSGNTLYGTTFYGGDSGRGTVFRIQSNGAGFTTLYDFPALVLPDATNSAGASPYGTLIRSGDTLFGTTHYGGAKGYGTVFQVNTDGTGFVNLHSFAGGSGGRGPFPGVTLSGLTLYGTTGGSANDGTIFSISFPRPQLMITRSGSNVILSWPTSPFGFTLESTPSLAADERVWNTASPEPVVFGEENVVINPASSTLLFYRLRQ
jgi:uncharacterized repeat protein (TIGR03803 family)